MIVGVPRESFPGERRVALVPAALANLSKIGLEVIVESGAGAEAGYPDAEYAAKGAKIISDRAEIFRAADIIVQVLCPGANDKTGDADLAQFRPNQIVIGFFRPMKSVDVLKTIADRGVTSFSIELMPRTTRAQSMDALSSMAHRRRLQSRPHRRRHLPEFFPMLTTAAGTITPARVLVLGVGVAGLQAIATARRLGAVVSAYDLRPAVKEQVQSLGARFVELPIEAQRRAGRPRLRHSAGRKFLPPPARTARQSHRRKRRRHHHRRHSRQESAHARHRRDGRRHGAAAPSSSISPPSAAATANSRDPAKKSSSTRTSPSSAGSISPAPSPITPARCTRATSPRSSRFSSKTASSTQSERRNHARHARHPRRRNRQCPPARTLPASRPCCSGGNSEMKWICSPAFTFSCWPHSSDSKSSAASRRCFTRR